MRTTGASAIHRAASSPPPECTGWPMASGPTGSSASATPGRPTRIWWPDERGRRPDPAYPEAMADESALNTARRSEEHTSELQSRGHLVCRLLLEKQTNFITTAINKNVIAR